MKVSEIPKFKLGTFTKSQMIELEIKTKKRIFFFWECKKRVAENHMEQNKKKIIDLESKLANAKNLEDLEK